ncbi:hypothetical protein [Paraburkholderia unamae]|uniref:Uncharacterized protein n=1 Tax=Paraburkholderia unamae TaxID=219649 RepID=A0ACC6RWD5_9BURK
MSKLGQYLWNWVVWIDEGANVLRGGDPHETVSSVMGKALQKGPAARGYRISCVLCKFLDLFQQDHCIKSIIPYIGTEAVAPDAEPTLPGNNGA